jgi:hypothetical protein
LTGDDHLARSRDRGERMEADLPVQAPVKYELALKLKTAKA